MPEPQGPLSLKSLSDRRVHILTVALLVQAGVFYGFSRPEDVAISRPLKEFPTTVGDYQLAQEGVVEKEVQDVLKADDLLTRQYHSPTFRIAAVDLFVAFFRTQRDGKAPHSPKNCLPGSGWIWQINDKVKVDIPGRAPIEVNRYVVQKGEARSLVLYWLVPKPRPRGGQRIHRQVLRG